MNSYQKQSYQSAQVTGTPNNTSQPYYQQQPMMSTGPVMSGYAQPVYVQPVYVQPVMAPMGYTYGYNSYHQRRGCFSFLVHQLKKDLKDLF